MRTEPEATAGVRDDCDPVAWHDAENGGFAADLNLFARLATDRPGGVLDLGAGSGRVALHLAAAGHPVTAVDHDPELLVALERRAADRGLEVVTVCTDVRSLELDRAHPGKDGAMLKANPMAAWSLAETWDYLRGSGGPTNELHARGFISIGCEPCTRATGPGEHERAGRWWWEEATKRECGLHLK